RAWNPGVRPAPSGSQPPAQSAASRSERVEEHLHAVAIEVAVPGRQVGADGRKAGQADLRAAAARHGGTPRVDGDMMVVAVGPEEEGARIILLADREAEVGRVEFP